MALSIALPIVFCGCVHNRFERRIAAAEVQVTADRHALEAAMDREEERLDWATASRLLQADNQRLRLARQQVADLKRQRRRFAFDQINPSLTAVANLSSALGSLSKLDDRDYGIRLFGSFSIPNPLTAYARRYSLELQYYQSELDLHELERRLRANLYGQFLQYDAMRNERPVRESNLELSGILQRLFQAGDSKRFKERRRRDLRLSLNDALNTPGKNWRPDTSTLPKISYENELERLDPDQGYASLALKQAAGGVEASLANLWRVKMEKLPGFSTGVGVPTLYDTNIDDEGFSADETRLFGSLTEQFDFSDREAQNARDAEQRAILLQESLLTRLERDIYTLEEAKTSYRILLNQRDRMKKLLYRMKQNPPSGDSPEIVLKRVRDVAALRDQIQQNELRRRQLDLEFWIWDEEYWDSPF